MLLTPQQVILHLVRIVTNDLLRTVVFLMEHYIVEVIDLPIIVVTQELRHVLVQLVEILDDHMEHIVELHEHVKIMVQDHVRILKE